MRREIIQSKTEPNKNNLWLSEEGLKKYGKNGWEPLGGGISPNTPIVDSISGDELVPINQNGENKAVRADELIKGGKEVFIITPDMFEQTATVIKNPYPTLTFTDDGLNKFTEAVEANKIIGIDRVIFNSIANIAIPFSGEGINPESGNYVFSTYVGVLRGDAYALSFEILDTITTNIDRYDVSIVSKNVMFMKNMSADGSFYLEPSMFVEPAAGETSHGLKLIKDYKQALSRAITTNKIIKINYNVLGYLDMIATPYASYTAEGYFILDNILKTSDTAFQATVIVPETNCYLTIYYNDGIFTAYNVDMSDIYILDDYMFIETAGDTPITSFELADTYKQSLMRAISTKKVIGISNLALYYLVQSISTSNINTREVLPSGFSIINLINGYDGTFVGHVYYGIDGILLKITCTAGVIAIEKETMLLGSGDGSKFLADDGSYKEISGNDNAITYRTINSKYWGNPTEMIPFDSDKFKDYLSEFKDELTSPKTGEIVYLDDYEVVLIAYANDNLTKEEWYNIEVTSNNNFGFYRLYKDMNRVWTLDKSIYNHYNRLEPTGNSENDSNINLSYIKYNSIGTITKNKTLSVDSGEIYVYQGEFSFGDTLYTITFPDTVKWSTDSVLEYKANHTYQFRIVNNLGVMKEFANA